jgi:hypothetical protein
LKSVVRKIDRALKRLYHLEEAYRAEDFLIKEPYFEARTAAVGSGRVLTVAADFSGALFLKSGVDREDLALGIYLNTSVWKELSTFRSWRSDGWSLRQLGAFVVAAEEVSHFHYLLHHASRGRSVSQLELELQGEVDRFVLTFYANLDGVADPRDMFARLFEQSFQDFRLADHLSEEEKTRYGDASHFGKLFVRKCERYLVGTKPDPRGFEMLRRFYRLNVTDKVSFVLG